MKQTDSDSARSTTDPAETAHTTETTTSTTQPSANSATATHGSVQSAEATGTFELSVCNGDGTPLEGDSFDCDKYKGPHYHIDGRCMGEASRSD